MTMDIPELIAQYDERDAEVERLEGLLKDAKKLRDETEAQLYEQMATSGYESLKHGGKTYTLKDTTYYSIAPEMQEAVMDSLEVHGFGSLIKRTVNQRTYSAFVREQVEQNGGNIPPWLDGGTKSYTKHEIGRRKAV